MSEHKSASVAGAELDQLSINTLRLLAVDAVEAAKSGHPGAPLACAPIAYLLYHRLMRYSPTDFKWIDRDRFVLSNGHASALLYGALHLAGFDLPLDELKKFRSYHSKTPGHPEYGETPGVEVTTGPLGQGLAMAAGIAIAEKHMAARFNQPDFDVVDHYTYVLCGDGDLMEGISHETCSLAGTLKLGKLIVFYDDNLISLDGPTELSYTEDVVKRFEAYHWQVIELPDGNDLAALEKAVEEAKKVTDKPTLIKVRTIIGYGSPHAGTNKVHGEALGPENTRKTKEFFGFNPDENFAVPEAAAKNWAEAKVRGDKAKAAWDAKIAKYKLAHPDLATEFERTVKGDLAKDWAKEITFFPTEKAVATRNAGQIVMQQIGKNVPELIGGAADLTASTKTIFKDGGNFHVDPIGRNIFFGVREFGMCAAVNGMAAHGGLIPFGSTFFTFSDYCRSALRMAALMSTHSLFVFTHDSVGLGEDGPTHQPIEQLMSLRAIPQLTDFRPADANETVVCWKLAIERKSASFMALSRQDLPVMDAEKFKVEAGVRKGAYVVEEAAAPDVILVAAGSEVALALKSVADLKAAGIVARVVSMPSFKIFEEQDQAYKMSIFPHGVAKISIEAGATMGWWKYIGRDGIAIGIDKFGASAPGPIVMEKYGFSTANVVEQAKKLVKKK